MTERPNRIRELREARGWSSDYLARLLGTTGATVRRLEIGQQNLTVEWMQRLAKALQVWPSDLLAQAAAADVRDEVATVATEATPALATGGITTYRVISDSVTAAGIAVDTIIAVDGRATPTAGDVCLIEIAGLDGTPHYVLRQWLPPGLLVTNRAGANTAMQCDDIGARVVGVVMRPAA